MNTTTTRRKLWQAYMHTTKVRDWAIASRDEAKKAGHLDNVQTLTDILFSNSKERANLRHLCKSVFLCDIETLEVYK